MCIHHLSRRLDLQSPLALRPISADHSHGLIDNLYLTGVHSTDSATTGTFTVNIYLLDSTLEDITNLLASQLDDMQKEGIHTSSKHLHIIVTVDATTNIMDTTFIGDEPIASGTYVTHPHPEGTSYVYIVTLPTFSPTTYGLTLLASRQMRWTSTLPKSSIPTRIPDNLKKPLLQQIPTITRAHADRIVPPKTHAQSTRKNFRDLWHSRPLDSSKKRPY